MYNSSLAGFINISIVNAQSKRLNIRNLSVNNSSFLSANTSTLTCSGYQKFPNWCIKYNK